MRGANSACDACGRDDEYAFELPECSGACPDGVDGSRGSRIGASGDAPEGTSRPAHVEREFRRYLECGTLAHGFARARCGDCGHTVLIAFSCKGYGVCPSCNARRMAEVAAQLVEQVFPVLPVRQWVLSILKRLRYFLQRDSRHSVPC